MKVTLKGQDLRLKSLSDKEYTEAERLARIGGPALDVCPTCDARDEIVLEEHGVRRFTNGTYRFRGEDFDCDCQAQMALRARYLLANIGEQYMRLDWSEFDGTEDARVTVAMYLENWQSFKKHGWGLEFGGPLGVGKTFAATHIGKELIKLGQRVYFLPFIEMVSAFEKQDGEEIEDRMRNTTYLILDEMLPSVSERQHQFYANRLEALIRHRTNHNLPTIITTNMPEEKLYADYPRTYSLLAAKQNRVDMSGSDARSGKIKIENMELIANNEVRPIS